MELPGHSGWPLPSPSPLVGLSVDELPDGKVDGLSACSVAWVPVSSGKYSALSVCVPPQAASDKATRQVETACPEKGFRIRIVALVESVLTVCDSRLVQ